MSNVRDKHGIPDGTYETPEQLAERQREQRLKDEAHAEQILIDAGEDPLAPGELLYLEDSYSRYIMDDDGPRVKLIRSAVGVGKTVGVLFGAAEFCLRVLPEVNGEPQRARVLVVRQDQTKLRSTILASFRAWFGAVTDDLTSMLYPIVVSGVPFVGTIDGKDRTVLIDWVFMGVANKEDASKLRSFEATCAIINEISYYDGSWIIQEVSDRLGRYPLALRDARGNSVKESYLGQKLILADFNPPDDLHWLYKLEHGTCPDAWKFYAFPPPLLKVLDVDGTIVGFENNPKADYAQKQPAKYEYWRAMAEDLLAIPGSLGKLEVDVFGNYGTSQQGKSVYPEWSDEFHIAKTTMVASNSRRMIVGFDHSGIHPAMVYAQPADIGVAVIHELYIGECIVEDFIDDVFIPFNNKMGYTKENMTIILDPADARDRTGTTARTMLMKRGFRCVYAPTNDPIKRQGAVKKLLVMRALRVAKACTWLIGGFRGRYNREKIRNTEHYKMLPDAEKNEYSHAADALSYIAVWLASGVSAMTPAAQEAQQQRRAGTQAFMAGGLV